MSIEDRQLQFKERLHTLLPADVHTSDVWGTSNIARPVPGSYLLGVGNLENFSPPKSLCMVSRLSPLPNVEIYLATLVSDQSMHDRLGAMVDEPHDPSIYSVRNNNTSMCLGVGGTIYLYNKKIGSLDSPSQSYLGASIPLENLYFSVFGEDVSLADQKVIDGIINSLKLFVGGAKLIQLALWQASASPSLLSSHEQSPENLANLIPALLSDLGAAHFIASETLVKSVVSSLITKPFLILTGLSGSGKSRIAVSVANWLSAEPSKQVAMVPVGPDWDSEEPVFGFADALHASENKYFAPANGILRLLIYANKEPGEPFFLVLDEMNLSHVERYFASLLSALESQMPIQLHNKEEMDSDGLPIPPQILLPKNVFIIGTVNIDETTYLFSPKVLDRANVVEFRVSKDEMQGFLSSNINEIGDLSGLGSSFSHAFLESRSQPAGNMYYDANNALVELAPAGANPAEGFVNAKEKLSADLLSVFEALKSAGAEFGYRTAGEIYRFVYVWTKLSGGSADYRQAVDAQFMQKLLPKLNGSARKLDPILTILEEKCDELDLPLSLDKIRRMRRSLTTNGFTSFTEA
jgi:hypothetical protein